MVGTKGELKVSPAAQGRRTLTKTTVVMLADGVNLSAGASMTLDAPPGSRVDLPVTVRNSGTIPVTGTILEFDRPRYFSMDQKRFSNCLYTDFWIACRFAALPGR